MVTGLSWKQNSTGTRVYYLYDGSAPVCELNSSGQVQGESMFGANGLIAYNDGSHGTLFYAFDERGNVAQRVDAGGNVASSDLYDAYGKLLSGNPSGDPYGFGAQAGYRTDAETGLCLLTYRYYDPAAGRFVTRDPAGYGGGINLYSYTQNNPTNWMDPSGHMPVLAFAGASGLAGTGLTLEGLGLGADATVFGAPVGGVLNIAGAVVLAGAAIYDHYASLPAPYQASSVPADKAYPGTDRNAQDKHDPLSDDYDHTKTPLIEHELPAGKTVDDALEDAWNNPVAGDWKNKKQVFGKPGYPVNRNGDEWLDMRCGGGKVHGWGVPGPK